MIQPVVANRQIILMLPDDARPRFILVAGEARWEAAQAAGLPLLPTIWVNMNHEQHAAASLALNGPYGRDDPDAVNHQLQWLAEQGYDLDHTGQPPWVLEPIELPPPEAFTWDAPQLDAPDVTNPDPAPHAASDHQQKPAINEPLPPVLEAIITVHVPVDHLDTIMGMLNEWGPAYGAHHSVWRPKA